MPLQPAIFLDRDGTLIRNEHYGFDPGRMQLLPGVIQGLQALQRIGYRFIVITNQSGIARGYFQERHLAAMHRRLRQILSAYGIRLDSIYYCPHHPDGQVSGFNIACGCRKPQPGMLHRAARERQVDLGRSWLVGDILNDVQAGNTAGCRTILIDLGTEDMPTTPPRTPTYLAHDFLHAARLILAHENRHAGPVVPLALQILNNGTGAQPRVVMDGGQGRFLKPGVSIRKAKVGGRSGPPSEKEPL